MKRSFSTFLFLLLTTRVLNAAEFLVTRSTDGTFEEGELRVVLQHVCDAPGDDIIRFAPTRLSEIRIPLETPLVIPADCAGGVTLIGSEEVDTLLDGSTLFGGGLVPGDSCALNIYSDGHVVRNFSFVNNVRGAGVCLFGRSNWVGGNRFGQNVAGGREPNQYGVVLSDAFARDRPALTAAQNQVIGNAIRFNSRHGIWGRTEDALIQGNTIEENDGIGILIAGDALRFMVGGPNPELDGNRIRHNREGGVVIAQRRFEETSEWHTISHNILSQNEGSGANLDLNMDGPTANDFEDEDAGPNQLLNYAHHFQAFPLAGGERYWGWGLDLQGERIELYGVAAEDLARKRTQGGGDRFFADAAVSDWGFAIAPGILSTGDWTTALTFDAAGNTSEFSLNLPVGADEDLDGIVDHLERATSAADADSDGDGLPDPVEDKNRDGFWNQNSGETSAALVDSDNDLLSDWAETHGDGVYDRGVDTDPLVRDTDGDGLLDGQEDANGDGVWDGHLGETSPLLIDSDADGFNDLRDTCPAVFNPGQEPWYCE